MEKKKIEKGSVQETLLLPLYGRKRAMEMYPGNFNDLDCQRIYNEVEIDYNRKGYLTGYRPLDKRYGFVLNTVFKHLDKSCMCQIIEIEFKQAVLERADDIGKSHLMSSFCMGAHFIALNRKTSLSPEECFSLYKDGLYNNKLFHMVLGNADSYLDEKKLPGRKKWSEEHTATSAMDGRHSH